MVANGRWRSRWAISRQNRRGRSAMNAFQVESSKADKLTVRFRTVSSFSKHYRHRLDRKALERFPESFGQSSATCHPKLWLIVFGWLIYDDVRTHRFSSCSIQLNLLKESIDIHRSSLVARAWVERCEQWKDTIVEPIRTIRTFEPTKGRTINECKFRESSEVWAAFNIITDYNPKIFNRLQVGLSLRLHDLFRITSAELDSVQTPCRFRLHATTRQQFSTQNLSQILSQIIDLRAARCIWSCLSGTVWCVDYAHCRLYSVEPYLKPHRKR